MTNREKKEEISFHCPDCGHRQHAMTPECPACGNARTLSSLNGCSVHVVSFAMNGGNRREFYRMLLSLVQLHREKAASAHKRISFHPLHTASAHETTAAM